MKPVNSLQAEESVGVAMGDSVYYRHPDTGQAHHGIVAAIGVHGFTADSEEGEHRVLWEGLLGHRRRAERKLTIVDRGEDGSIMEDENGKRVYVRGNLPDAEAPGAPEDDSLRKAQVVRELAAAGFEPMVEYVHREFGENFVYKALPDAAPAGSPDVVEAIKALAREQAAQFQALCAAIAMMADRIGDTGALQASLMAVLAEARKPQDVSISMPEGFAKSEAPVVHVSVPDQPAPIVNIAPAPITVEAPVIHVAAPEVTIQPPAIEVNVPPANVTVSMPPRRTVTDMEHNKEGLVTRAIQTETDA